MRSSSNKYKKDFPIPDELIGSPLDGHLEFKVSFLSELKFGIGVCETKGLLQVMLLGDSCTGKTCLLIRFKDGTFLNNNFISTVGIDYRNKVVQTSDDTKVKLQIWDTAGQVAKNMTQPQPQRDGEWLG